MNTVRGSRPGKNVQLTEAEIRGLCLKSREIFLSQPILLELEAPLKICGETEAAPLPVMLGPWEGKRDNVSGLCLFCQCLQVCGVCLHVFLQGTR